ncbi:MAG: tetratricopeptide repeat protein [Spirochaetales bacterium]|nr:tetratricopeptide repeat protein [Spirochaetales bacterium]
MMKIKILILMHFLTLCVVCVAPPRRSSIQESSFKSVADPVAHKKALSLVNQGNRLFAQKQFARALQLAEESLGIAETFEGYYLKGSLLFQLNRTAEALESYAEAEKLQGDNEQLLLSIAVAATAAGDLEGALKRYETLHRLKPEEGIYPFKAGVTMRQLGRYQEAHEMLKKADKPGFSHRDQLFLQLGDTALELKEFALAEEYFKKAREINPKLAAANRGGAATQMAAVLEEGNRKLAARDYPGALASYERGRELAPDQAAPYLLSGAVLLTMKRYQEAENKLTRALQLAPADPKGYSLLGSVYQKMTQYARARKVLESGLKVAPESYDILNKIGMVERDEERHARAIDAFQQALRIKPDYTPARINLAFAFLSSARYEDARREFTRARSEDPSNADLKDSDVLVDVYRHLDRGDNFFKRAQLDAAIREYAAAQKIRPLPLVYNSLGRTEFQRKRYKQAEEHYQKTLTLDAENVPALQGLLRVYNVTGRKADSKRIADQFARAVGSDLLVQITMGQLLEDEGKLEQALKHYEGLKARDNSGTVDRRLGYVHYKLGEKENEAGRYEGALARFKEARKLNPDIEGIDQSIQVVTDNIEFSALLPIIEKAERAFARKDYAGALQSYEAAYKKSPRPLLLVKMSDCYIAMGQQARGLALLEEAARKPNASVTITEAIHTNILKQGKVSEAEQGFRRIVTDDPSAYFSHYKLGVIAFRKKNYSGALEHLDQALLYNDTFTPAYLAAGVSHYQLGQRAEARSRFEKAMTVEARNPLASYNLGVMQANERKGAEAKRIYQELIASYPDFPDAPYQLAYLHFEAGEWDQAEAMLKKCVQIDSDPLYLYALSQVYEKQRQGGGPEVTRKLRDTYQEIIQRYPDSAYAQEARTALRTLNPDSRIVQDYPAGRSTLLPRLFNADLYQVDGNGLRVMAASSKQERYQIHQPGIIDFEPGAVLQILTAKSLRLHDGLSGQLLREIGAPAGARSILGSALRPAVAAMEKNRPVVYQYSDKGEPLARHEGQPGSTFYDSGGRIFELHSGPASRLVAIDTAEELTFKEKVRLEVGELFLAVSATKVYVLDGQTLKIKEEIAHKGGSVHLSGPRIFLTENLQTAVYDGSGKSLARFELPIRPAGAGSLSLAGEDLLYLGSDGNLRLIDQKGKARWEFPASRSAAFTLYY